jgi:hypothetical protein
MIDPRNLVLILALIAGFAFWVWAMTKKPKKHVRSRPIPLRHYLHCRSRLYD